MNSTQNQPEIWKPIPGFEGSYEVSDHGRVRSLDRISERSDGKAQRFRGKIIVPYAQSSGHLNVHLWKYGKRSSHRVHRLVLQAFVGPCPDNMECRHLNDIPNDNRLENLVWGTSSENSRDCVNNGHHPEALRTTCDRGHKLEAPNLNPAYVSKGQRRCLACQRARNMVNYRKHLKPLIQEVSDASYAAILAGEPTDYRTIMKWITNES